MFSFNTHSHWATFFRDWLTHPWRVASIEFGSNFAQLLARQFPNARVLRMDAAQLYLRDIFSGAAVATAISGLPLRSLPPRKVIQILYGAFSALSPGGAFYQFTYGPRCPVSLAILNRLGLRATLVGRTIRNLPPAAVYRITRRQPLAYASRAPLIQRAPWRECPTSSGAATEAA